VLAAEHLFRLGRFDFGLQVVQRPSQIAEHVLAGVDPLDQHTEVVGATTQRIAQRDVVLETPPALHHLLRRRLIAPEAGRADLLFELCQFVV
jgi:hypothetical protein